MPARRGLDAWCGGGGGLAETAAELTIDDGGKRKEGIKGGRDGGEGRQHFVALKTTLNASLLGREGEGVLSC